MKSNPKLFYILLPVITFCCLILTIYCAFNTITGSNSKKPQKTKSDNVVSHTSSPSATPKVTQTPEPAASATQTPANSDTASGETTLTISAAGDCTLGSDKNSPSSVNFYSVYKKEQNDAYFFQNVKKYFKNDDLTLVNLEGTLSTSTTRMDKTYAFNGSPDYVNILKAGSIEAVSFANNHCRDYGAASYDETIENLKKADISYSSFDKVCIYKVKDKKIGMVAVNGLLGLDYSKQLISSGIKKLKKKHADLILVSIHAGIEHTNVINAVQTQLTHYAVDLGADLVLGHHPHTLQGIEKYKGVYIVYSLANFCFGGNTNPVDKDTIIFQQTFTLQDNNKKADDNIRIIPCRVSSTSTINDYQPTPVKGSAKSKIINRMNALCKPFHLTFAKNGRLVY